MDFKWIVQRQMAGERRDFEALDRQSAFARAVMQVAGSAIAASTFRQAALQSSGIQTIVSPYRHVTFMHVAQTAACNALHPLEKRLARWLLQTSDRVGLGYLILPRISVLGCWVSAAR